MSIESVSSLVLPWLQSIICVRPYIFYLHYIAAQLKNKITWGRKNNGIARFFYAATS